MRLSYLLGMSLGATVLAAIIYTIALRFLKNANRMWLGVAASTPYAALLFSDDRALVPMVEPTLVFSISLVVLLFGLQSLLRKPRSLNWQEAATAVGLVMVVALAIGPRAASKAFLAEAGRGCTQSPEMAALDLSDPTKRAYCACSTKEMLAECGATLRSVFSSAELDECAAHIAAALRADQTMAYRSLEIQERCQATTMTADQAAKLRSRTKAQIAALQLGEMVKSPEFLSLPLEEREKSALAECVVRAVGQACESESAVEFARCFNGRGLEVEAQKAGESCAKTLLGK